MKKILLSFLLLPFTFLLQAQEIERTKVFSLLKTNQASIGLSAEDLENIIISNAFYNKSSKADLVYLQQTFKGIPVLNQIQVLAFKSGQVVSNSGGRIKDIASKVNTSGIQPAVSAENAVRTSVSAKKLKLTQPLAGVTTGSKINFGKLGVAHENITASLIWVPQEDGKVKLAWQVYLVPRTSPDYFLIRVDAIANKIISETNLTEYCDWSDPKNKAGHAHNNVCTSENINKINTSLSTPESLTGPAIINGATYRVVPFPAESPLHPGGAHALRTDPWNAAPGNATTLKWHSNGTTDYTITRGNNVWAQEDLNANNGVGFSPTSTTTDPLTFNFVPDYNVSPTQTSPVQNQQFAITNLFYWNNIIHDIVYQYGFDEVSGNFQSNNSGRGGLGNDFVLADAQDGDFVPPNQNNANFSTPPDGGSPRMQMYLFDSVTRLTVTLPSSIAGTYEAVESNLSPNNKLSAVGPLTAQVVYYNDNTGGTHEACVPPSNSLTGKIALIVRGTCSFVIKIKNAQDAGAVGVIVINNASGAPITMGGGPDPTITIPAIMVSDVTGGILIGQLGNNLTVTLAAGVNRDGDLDNGVIVHEYGHGISNRLTGGAATSGCVSNAEQMGEGWSDYYALMLTQDWASSNVNTGFTTSRGIGTYVLGQSPAGPGFRTQRYSTDFSINNRVFTAVLPGTGLQHSRGEIWCATLWDMTWNIIQQLNNITPNIYTATGAGGNIIALKLVTEGMKLQPCQPGFIDARNAILQADQILYNGAYSCAIREAFRRRGMGPLASQGSSSSVTDQIPDFSAAVTMNSSVNVLQAAEGQNIIYTHTVTTCSPVTNYLITDTLPSNVTYVSGGTYNAATRVVSFNVSLALQQTQTYPFTVSVNAGSFFPTVTLLNEPVSGPAMPATLTPTSNTATQWVISTTQSHSAPASVFSENLAIPSEQLLTTAAFPLGTTPTQLSFWHLYNTELGYDGGVVEVSTDGGFNWSDLGDKMYLNKYNAGIDPTSGTSIAGKQAFTGNSVGFIKTSINLASFTGQSTRFRWKFVSDDGTAAIGWYVDDIQLKSEPLVIMRSNLFSNTGTRVTYDDTSTLIIQSTVCINVAITTQPVNVTACVGGNATFTVVATGSTPTYQWQVSTDGGTNFTNITGATSATLTLNAVTATMTNYRYRVIVSNACPSTITSSAAILTISTPAVVTAQPANTTVCAGTTATFTVTATGSNLIYQWQLSTDGGTTFTNITGATAATLTLTAVTSGQNNYVYRVVVSGCGPTGVNSANATLTVTAGTSITTQPSNTGGCTGGNATFTVVAAGAGLTYQWQISTDGGLTWNNIAGQAGASLNVTNITTAMNNNRFRVIVTGSCGVAVTSASATLTVTSSAVITTQPLSTTVCAGATATFVAVATGSAFQWQVSTDGGVTFTNITGATSLTLTIPSVTAAMNNNPYRLSVSSCSAVTLNSNAATLTVNNSATITTQPSNASVCTGANASFTVTASGTALTYQWQVSTDGGATFTNITGATAATLALTNVTTAMNNNRYRVVVGNSCPTGVTSSAAILAVSSVTSTTIQPANTTTCAGNNATFTVASSGTGQTYQWQVSTDGGTTFTNIPGETGTTLTLSNVAASMNNNRYRVNVTGCGTLFSTSSTLTVNSAPVITISASPSTRIISGGNTTLAASSSTPISSFAWLLNGNVITGSTGSSIVVTSSNLGLYTVRGTDANGCFSLSNQLTISDSTVSTAFIYPNPSRGSFFVQYNSTTISSLSRVITVHDDKGARVYSKLHVVTQPGEKMSVNLSQMPSGIYMLQLSDAAGKKLAKGKVMIN